jgi:hypothetical protein
MGFLEIESQSFSYTRSILVAAAVIVNSIATWFDHAQQQQQVFIFSSQYLFLAEISRKRCSKTFLSKGHYVYDLLLRWFSRFSNPSPRNEKEKEMD